MIDTNSPQIQEVWDSFLERIAIARLRLMTLPEYTAVGRDHTFWPAARMIATRQDCGDPAPQGITIGGVASKPSIAAKTSSAERLSAWLYRTIRRIVSFTAGTEEGSGNACAPIAPGPGVFPVSISIQLMPSA